MSKAKKVPQKDDSVFVSRFKQLFPNNATNEQIADCISKGGFPITRQSVGNWLSGHNMPNVNQLVGIAQAFHVSVDWLVGVSDVKSANPVKRSVSEYTGLDELALNELQYFTNAHSCIKSADKKLYTEYDDSEKAMNRLFHLGFIQKLSELLAELEYRSESFMDDSNLSLETYADYKYRNEQCDLISFKVQKLMFALLNEFDAREQNPEQYKMICQRIEQIINDSIEFE